MEEKNKNTSILTIIVTAIAIIAIVVLAFLYYYFIVVQAPGASSSEVVKNMPVKNITKQNAPKAPETPAKTDSFSTQVIKFVPPENLPQDIKDGYCLVNSIAQPYRQDAWRCMSGNSIYDPCFSTALNDVVFCKMNPLDESGSFLIKLTKPLPQPSLPKNALDNWAWFIELKDGTFCSPYTGTRPLFQGQAAYYGCKSSIKGQQVVLIGDLIKGPIWTGKKATLVKSGAIWNIQSSEDVEIKTVWQ